MDIDTAVSTLLVELKIQRDVVATIKFNEWDKLQVTL